MFAKRSESERFSLASSHGTWERCIKGEQVDDTQTKRAGQANFEMARGPKASSYEAKIGYWLNALPPGPDVPFPTKFRSPDEFRCMCASAGATLASNSVNPSGAPARRNLSLIHISEPTRQAEISY